MDNYLTATQAAQRWQREHQPISGRTGKVLSLPTLRTYIQRAIRSGALPAIPTGPATATKLIPIADFERWLNGSPDNQ